METSAPDEKALGSSDQAEMRGEEGQELDVERTRYPTSQHSIFPLAH